MAEAEAPVGNPDTSADEVSQPVSGLTALTVKVYAPFQVYFEGEAKSVSAVNDVGPFDILPGHHNFLCMLVPCQVKIITPSDEDKTVKINRALMHVHSNQVTVFVDV